MIELEKAVLLIVLSLSAWSALVLSLDKRGQRTINYCLALILVSLCIPQAYFYSRLLLPPDGVLTMALMSQTVIWLKGPFLWVMVRLAIGRQPTMVALHFIPFVLAACWMIIRPDQLLVIGQLGLLHALVYSLISLWLLIGGRARLSLIYHEYPNTSYFWLLWVIGGLVLTVLADFVLMGFIFIHQVLLLDAITIVSSLISVYLLSIAFFSVYRPAVFFNHDWQPETINPADQQPEPVPFPDEKNWRELDESLAQQLAQKLEQLMHEESLYRQGELSLAQLAARLGVTVHQASELLNVHLGASFYDYLNRYRLHDAASLLRDPKCEWRILDIAFESGFSNKNSFYRCFRSAFGQTPLEYRNRHVAKTMDVAL